MLRLLVLAALLCGAAARPHPVRSLLAQARQLEGEDDSSSSPAAAAAKPPTPPGAPKICEKKKSDEVSWSQSVTDNCECLEELNSKQALLLFFDGKKKEAKGTPTTRYIDYLRNHCGFETDSGEQWTPKKGIKEAESMLESILEEEMVLVKPDDTQPNAEADRNAGHKLNRIVTTLRVYIIREGNEKNYLVNPIIFQDKSKGTDPKAKKVKGYFPGNVILSEKTNRHYYGVKDSVAKIDIKLSGDDATSAMPKRCDEIKRAFREELGLTEGSFESGLCGTGWTQATTPQYHVTKVPLQCEVPDKSVDPKSRAFSNTGDGYKQMLTIYRMCDVEATILSANDESNTGEDLDLEVEEDSSNLCSPWHRAMKDFFYTKEKDKTNLWAWVVKKLPADKRTPWSEHFPEDDVVTDFASQTKEKRDQYAKAFRKKLEKKYNDEAALWAFDNPSRKSQGFGADAKCSDETIRTSIETSMELSETILSEFLRELAKPAAERGTN